MAAKKKATPTLKMAVLCETSVEGKDGTISVIRVIDRIHTVNPADIPPHESEPHVTTVNMVLMFGGVGVQGIHQVTVDATPPSGKKHRIRDFKGSFPGGDKGLNVRGDLPVIFTEAGIHHFDVRIDGRLMSRIRLEVLHLPSKSGQGSGSNSQPD